MAPLRDMTGQVLLPAPAHARPNLSPRVERARDHALEVLPGEPVNDAPLGPVGGHSGEGDVAGDPELEAGFGGRAGAAFVDPLCERRPLVV